MPVCQCLASHAASSCLQNHPARLRAGVLERVAQLLPKHANSPVIKSVAVTVARTGSGDADYQVLTTGALTAVYHAICIVTWHVHRRDV